MMYITNGYYFFNKSTSKNAENYGGFSFFRMKKSVRIEFLPNTLQIALSSQKQYTFALAVNTQRGQFKYISAPVKPVLMFPFTQEFTKIAAAALISDGLPVAIAAPQGTDVLPDFMSAQSQQKTPPKPEKPVSFDPFGTTNSSYTWHACTSRASLSEILKASDITLPVSIEESADTGFQKYGHTLLGRYTEENTKRKFLILGIPTDDPKHSCAYNYKYEAARFVAASKHYGNNRYAGYHLYYIDEKSTALVKVVVR